MELFDLRVKTRSFSDCIEFFAQNCLVYDQIPEQNSLEWQVFQKIREAFAAQAAAYELMTMSVSRKPVHSYEKLLTSIFGIGVITAPSFSVVLFEQLQALLRSSDFDLSSKNKLVEHVWSQIALKLLSGHYVWQLTELDKPIIDETLKLLTPREEGVIRMHFGLDSASRVMTLEDIAQHYGVTRERIRQIECKALRKLRHPSRSRRLKPLIISNELRFQDLIKERVLNLGTIEQLQAELTLVNEDLESTGLVKGLRQTIDRLTQTNAELLLNRSLDNPVDLPFLEKSVDELELTVRTYNCLKNADINTVKEICQLTEKQLMSVKNLGRKSLRELKDLLYEHGLTLTYGPY